MSGFRHRCAECKQMKTGSWQEIEDGSFVSLDDGCIDKREARTVLAEEFSGLQARIAALETAVMALHATTQLVPARGGMVRVDVLMLSADRMAELYELARAGQQGGGSDS